MREVESATGVSTRRVHSCIFSFPSTEGVDSAIRDVQALGFDNSMFQEEITPDVTESKGCYREVETCTGSHHQRLVFDRAWECKFMLADCKRRVFVAALNPSTRT